MSDPNEEKNVEELLSQLQGIFGKLSKPDEDDARAKVSPPPVQAAPVIPTPPDPKPEPASAPEPVLPKPETAPEAVFT